MKIKVCSGKACKDKFSDYIIERLQNDKQRFNLKNLEFEECLCLGQCTKGPNVIIQNETKNYMTPAKVSELIFNNNTKKKK